jgi:hypothetical protein
MPQYEATMSLWRPMAEMEAMMPMCIAIKLAMSLIITYIFTRNYEAKGVGEGARFGLYIGLLLGVVQFAGYTYLPMPMSLAVAWFITGVAYGVGAGIVASLVYKRL